MSLRASSSKQRMNSSPMILRLRSGSVTPLSLSRKRSLASTATSGMPNVPEKVSTTRSASRMRIMPWSTNTQVSRSPMALCMSSAATEESTPPDRPQDGLVVADLGADLA